MITGVVQSDEGRIRLRVKGPKRRKQEIEAVIDTGYTAALSLQPARQLMLTVSLAEDQHEFRF